MKLPKPPCKLPFGAQFYRHRRHYAPYGRWPVLLRHTSYCKLFLGSWRLEWPTPYGRAVIREKKEPCPLCGTTIGVSHEWVDDTFIYGVGSSAPELYARVLRGSCTSCAFDWTGHSAEMVRQRAIDEYLFMTSEQDSLNKGNNVLK